MNKKTIQKLAFLSVIILSVFVFASCSKQQHKPQDNQQGQDQQQTNDSGNNNQQQVTDPGNDDQQQQDTNPYEGWQTYRNEEYNYTLKYPANWKIKEVNVYNNDLGVQRKYVEFTNSDNVLVFYQWNIDENFSTGRTGVGAGDFENLRTVKADGVDVEFKSLVYEGKTREVFFSGSSVLHKIGGYITSKKDSYSDSFSFNEEFIEISEKVVGSLNQ